MDYVDLRRKFVELSGRYDLVKADWQDSGADFFINAGQKMLDRAQDGGKMRARYVTSLAAGTVVKYVTGLRAIKGVWISNVDGMTELYPNKIETIRSWYGKKLSTEAQSMPRYYAPAQLRPAPDTATATDLSGLYDIEDLILYDSVAKTGNWTYNGIIIMPPPDQAYTLSIWGLFYSPTLSATLSSGTWTQTKSFWSEAFPEILLKAALYELEAFYRNTEGMKDWDNALSVDMKGLDHDYVEEDLNGNLQMEG